MSPVTVASRGRGNVNAGKRSPLDHANAANDFNSQSRARRATSSTTLQVAHRLKRHPTLPSVALTRALHRVRGRRILAVLRSRQQSQCRPPIDGGAARQCTDGRATLTHRLTPI
jgi:hypothetical protein